MSTVISDLSAYATSADLIARYDVRDICQWVSDTAAPVSQGSLSSNSVLTALFADASGMVEAALLAVDRYSALDLQNLITAGGNSANFLKRLVCDLVAGMLIERRPYLDRDIPPAYLRALEWLEELRNGKRIFAFQEVADAGNAKVTIDSVYDIQSRNLASNQAARYFGADRAQDFVPGTSPGSGSNVVS